MNWPIFISTFSLIFIAELPDKTALATVMMAARGRPRPMRLATDTFIVLTSIAELCCRHDGYMSAPG